METGVVVRNNGRSESYGGAAMPQAPTRTLGFLAVAAAILATFAAVLESVSHLCAEWRIDPMPNGWYAAAYGEVVLTLLANNMLLKAAAGAPMERQRLMAVSVATSSALVTATVATFLILPIMPLALFAILIFGIGLLGFSPVCCVLALVGQANLIGQHQRRQPARIRRQIALASVVAAAVTLWLLCHGAH